MPIGGAPPCKTSCSGWSPFTTFCLVLFAVYDLFADITSSLIMLEFKRKWDSMNLLWENTEFIGALSNICRLNWKCYNTNESWEIDIMKRCRYVFQSRTSVISGKYVLWQQGSAIHKSPDLILFLYSSFLGQYWVGLI